MKTILFCLLMLPALVNFSQDFKTISEITLDKPGDYEDAEPYVLESANYLFNNPVDKDENNRKIALSLILRWMEGTSHTFILSEHVTNLTKGSTELFGLYLAGMTKIVLENEGEKLSNDTIYSEVEKMLVDYCKNDQNNIKPSKPIKKLMKK